MHRQGGSITDMSNNIELNVKELGRGSCWGGGGEGPKGGEMAGGFSLVNLRRIWWER